MHICIYVGIYICKSVCRNIHSQSDPIAVHHKFGPFQFVCICTSIYICRSICLSPMSICLPVRERKRERDRQTERENKRESKRGRAR